MVLKEVVLLTLFVMVDQFSEKQMQPTKVKLTQ